jgi:2-C-methyl-D-erythritol 4-phosphate cytidylyltransferase/2-C-methyl-D-erythritol 2,4-cyclodiphosphate synthase
MGPTIRLAPSLNTGYCMSHVDAPDIYEDSLAKVKPKTALIVVAAGRGTRAGNGERDLPKQYRPLAGIPVLRRTITRLLAMDSVDLVLPVIHPDDAGLYQGLALSHAKLLAPVNGGDTRQLSVLAGLQALEEIEPQHVLIHDAARPFVDAQTVNNVVTALEDADAVLPVTLVVDTIKRSTDGRTVGGTEDRTQLYAAQTPQGFDYKSILSAHRRAAEMSDGFTDDAAIAEWARIPVTLAWGSMDNIKLTSAEDFTRAERFLQGEEAMETRVGTGYDVHPFTPGDAVILGGVTIPHTAKLKGHSDADAGLHVITDALLGALAEGDIGTHFPPSDPQWKGAPSSTFLKFAVERVAARGGRIINLDLTIICEAPKIAPHTKDLRQSIADICNISVDRVSVKATTSEKMGFVGRQEGIATMAAVSVQVPRSED